MNKLNSVKNFFKNKGKVFYIVIIACVIAVGVIGITFAFRNDDQKNLTKELETLGAKFYEDFYYDHIGSNDEERSNFLSRYSTIGIKVDLDNLARTLDNKDEILARFVNSKTKEDCNRTNTKVTIYPQDPYGKTNYKIEVTLDYGFDKK